VGLIFSGSSHNASSHQRISSSAVPVNTVPDRTVAARVRTWLFGPFTRLIKMSERPQLGTSAISRSAANESVFRDRLSERSIRCGMI